MKEKEKRTERKTLPLTPSEFAAFTAAANASGLPLTTWLVQAAREKLAEQRQKDRDADWVKKFNAQNQPK